MPRCGEHFLSELERVCVQTGQSLETANVYPEIREAIGALVACIRSSVDLKTIRRKQKRLFSRQQLLNKCRWERYKRIKAEKALEDSKQTLVGLRVRNTWFARAMLSDPTQSLPKLEKTCAEFLVAREIFGDVKFFFKHIEIVCWYHIFQIFKVLHIWRSHWKDLHRQSSRRICRDCQAHYEQPNQSDVTGYSRSHFDGAYP